MCTHEHYTTKFCKITFETQQEIYSIHLKSAKYNSRNIYKTLDMYQVTYLKESAKTSGQVKDRAFFDQNKMAEYTI